MGSSAGSPRLIRDLDELSGLVGETLGESDWVEIDQTRIDLFAEATGDHQWIHTDPVRAAESAFGSTIAHGYLTLSLIPALFGRIVKLGGVSATLNYGIDRARFPAPVPVDSRLRGVLVLSALERTPGRGTATFTMTIERAGSERPACVVNFLFVFLE